MLSATGVEGSGAGVASTRVLVVDDEPDIIFLYEMILRSARYEVISALNGREALAVLADTMVDAILTDMMMPIMDGLEFIAHLRADPRTSAIPIAMVSAGVLNVNTAPTGVDMSVHKPFQMKQIVELVGRLTGGR